MEYSTIEGKKLNSSNYEYQGFRYVKSENMAIPSTSNVHYFEATLVLAPE